MTQSQTQNQNLTEGLNRIRRWRDQYRSMQPPSPLEDVNQLAAKLEMTHAHPSGIAQLFASGHVRLDSLFRDTGVLKAAERHIGRVLDDQAAKRRISGVAELSLVVGVATWKGNALPVLLYPVSVTIEGDGLSTTIRFTGRVALNVAFVNTLREQGVFLDEDSLFDGASYDSGTPETSAMFARISSEASERISDFAIAVSYTHLDVYKRQVARRQLPILRPGTADLRRHRRPVLRSSPRQRAHPARARIPGCQPFDRGARPLASLARLSEGSHRVRSPVRRHAVMPRDTPEFCNVADHP